ncbi:C40 family peptidase [uncultured Algibacter sp.]|uniref:C40 family peptidase n=1 Tax=uncultured Algibacter sp. TaxID=298659 RepID=UPI0030EF1DAB|tara:strand:- start:286 stop:816 length:531 start_codon:yes stop_codon:yes gene_type:complete
MKKTLLILLLIISFSSCKSSKRAKERKTASSKIITKKSKKENIKIASNKSKADYIIDYAKQFEGTRYKWGGTTKSGMDCSGLVFESFKSSNILLPRISRDMAKKGNKIQLKKVLKGDLLFFKTGNRRNSINHVGLIVDIRDNDIKFIHATTNNGVIISGLNETYWLNAFYEARRIL